MRKVHDRDSRPVRSGEHARHAGRALRRILHDDPRHAALPVQREQHVLELERLQCVRKGDCDEH